jgi:hypothetical protein
VDQYLSDPETASAEILRPCVPSRQGMSLYVAVHIIIKEFIESGLVEPKKTDDKGDEDKKGM